MSRIKKYKGFLADHGKLNVPRKIGAGIAYRISCVILAFDVEQIKWKAIDALSNKANFYGRLGSYQGPGFGVENQWYYRLGLEWNIDECWTARFGYRHSASPIRRSQTLANLLTLDTVEDILTLGATWRYHQCSEVSIMGAYGFENTIKGKHSILPTLGGGEANLHEQKYAVGMAWSWLF